MCSSFALIFAVINLETTPLSVFYFSLFGLISGALLFKNNRYGYFLSFLNQLLQTASIAIQTLTYKYLTGIGFLYFFNNPGDNYFKFEAGIFMHFADSSSFATKRIDFYSNLPSFSNTSSIGLNFIALTVCIYLIFVFPYLAKHKLKIRKRLTTSMAYK